MMASWQQRRQRKQRYQISLIFVILWLRCNALAPAFIFGIKRQSTSEIFSSNNNNNDSWLESLKARQQEIDKQQDLIEKKWISADCVSTIPISFPAWVRRLAVDEYPLVAAGSHTGNIYVANMETGTSIAQSFGQENEIPLGGQEEMMRILFSGCDGGGTLAIALRKTLICSASRQGSVQLWRVDNTQAELISQGSLQALQGVLVTCIQLDDDYLWVGTADGRLQAYALSSSDVPLALQTQPELEWNLASPILSLSLCPEIGYGVVSTAKGSVQLFSMEDDDEMVTEWVPPIDSKPLSTVYIISTTLVPYKNGGYAIVCGCNNGSIHLQRLNYQNGMFDTNKMAATNSKTSSIFQSRHAGPVKCLVSPTPGLMLSGGQDGTVRVWYISESEDELHFQYQFAGYKVWLGTLWTDGLRIVSDGADNSIIVHDFSKSV
mmetsp:Transcript_17500/g.25889  ORF Transcript_17500/g.25889 Transcript_17500/m.25889 type:complete len:435 (-) Transcript_17500:2252-3556(-)